MSRRRYLSTSISRDSRVNQLALQAGDFAVLLYTWLIPHAEDDGIVYGDPDEIAMTVIPGRRDRTADDVAAALEAMHNLGLVYWDKQGRRVLFPPETFYKHQSYVPKDKRRTWHLPPHDTDAQRTSAKNNDEQHVAPRASDEQRGSAQNAVSPSPSPSPSTPPIVPPKGDNGGGGGGGEENEALSPEPPAQPAPSQPDDPRILWRREYECLTCQFPPERWAGEIDAFLHRGMEAAVVEEAIRRAVQGHDGQPPAEVPLAAAAHRLGNWWAAGVRTTADLQALERRQRERAARRQRDSPERQGSGGVDRIRLLEQVETMRMLAEQTGERLPAWAERILAEQSGRSRSPG